ncbi:hypothetical protein ACL07V_28525 [Streptomyces sp. MB22_4]|uniref:hypothetical protein n=1 Tax=Streptomyces sp. MB22_4 TaxID=3383120 RepID=UPI0039A1C6A5
MTGPAHRRHRADAGSGRRLVILGVAASDSHTVASGITSFEDGGISASLAAWEEVDRRCGEPAELGVVVDRELFGTLTAVLVPPSISLAVSVLEAVPAVRAGVRCVSIAYPQGGHVVAALRAIPELAARYLGPDVLVPPVLRESR